MKHTTILIILIALPAICVCCNTVLTSSSGTFQSPNYPSDYPNSADCAYQISVSAGKVVKLRINNLDLESDSGCSYDALAIYDGSGISATKLATLCGNSHNGKEFRSSGNDMYVKFTSDGSVTKSGFQASFSEESASGGGCSVQLSGLSGSFSSPGFPNSYPNNANCLYTITVPNGKSILFEFPTFEVESGTNCAYDKLAIYDGGSLVANTCGSGEKYYSSTTNKVVMRFTSDSSVAMTGFTATFRAYDRGLVNSMNCGMSKVAQSRIVGGTDAKRGAWPWQIAMYKNGYFACGGTLIAPDWVLTASHCVVSSGTVQSPDTFIIVAGDLHRSLNDTSEQYHRVSKVISHPQYDGNTLINDIALLKLSKPVLLNDHVNTACLPSQDQVLAPGTNCYMTGWGKIKHPGSSHPMLQQALTPVKDRTTCQAKLDTTGWGLKITDAMVCVGVASSNIAACHGDSGGPLVCPDASGRFYLQGANSWGSPTCNIQQLYDVFARVAKFRNWVESMIRSN